MFQKILIAEDHDSANIGVKTTIEELKIANAEYAKYCDTAFLKIKRAIHDIEPFDLLITDLSFEPTSETDTLKSGWDLIQKLKDENIQIKIIVFSVEDKPILIRKLFEEYKIDGFVVKSRNDSHELKRAIQHVLKGEKYKSPEIEQKLHQQKNNYILDDIDFLLMKMLCKGYSQDEISVHFAENKIVPSSKSSIEKKLKTLRDEFQAKTNIELIIILQKLGFLKD